MANLPDNMTLTEDGDYDFATQPGARYVINLDSEFDGATFALHRKASDGNFYATGRSLTAAGEWDFRAAGFAMRIVVSNAGGSTAAVMTLANVPGVTIDDLTTDLAADVTGTLPVANGGWGTTTGSFTSPTITLNTSANGNIALAPHGSGAVTVAGFSTTESRLRIGSIEIQPFSLNNGFITENAYHNGTNWKYRAAGAAGVFYFNNGEGHFRFFTSGAAGANLPNSGNSTQFKVHNNGTVALGGTMNAIVGDYTSAGLVADSTGIRILGGTPASAAAAGVAGSIRWDADYIYVCTATNTWKRAAIATW